jgi:hypothetical protein
VAVAFRNLTTAGATTGTTATSTPPTGLANDDILVMMIYKEATGAVTWPSGFTQLASITAADSSFMLAAAWKRAASESGNYSATFASAYYSNVMAAYSGCITSGDPQDATATTNAPGSQTNQITGPSITTVSANTLIVSYVGDVTGWVLTKPASMASRVVFDDIGLADEAQAAAGPSGTKAWTTNGTSQTAAITIALKPPSTAASLFIPGPRMPQAILAR